MLEVIAGERLLREVRGYYRIEVTSVKSYCGREVTNRG
jgi:hypothetical protein